MNTNNPNIAIITAAYNASSTIKEAIESISNQDYNGKIQHWICDDASTDTTIEVVLSMFSDNPAKNILFDYDIYSGIINGIKTHLLCAKKNRKQGVCRNHCIRAAWNWADAFVILDADDVKYPNFVARHVEEWLVDPELINIVYSDYHIYDENTGISIHEFKHPYNRQHLLHECIISSGALYSKEVFKKGGLYMEDTFNVEDYGQVLKASNFGIAIHIAEPLWQYRITGNNSTNNKNKELIENGYRQMGENYNQWIKNPIGYNG